METTAFTSGSAPRRCRSPERENGAAARALRRRHLVVSDRPGRRPVLRKPQRLSRRGAPRDPRERRHLDLPRTPWRPVTRPMSRYFMEGATSARQYAGIPPAATPPGPPVATGSATPWRVCSLGLPGTFPGAGLFQKALDVSVGNAPFASHLRVTRLVDHDLSPVLPGSVRPDVRMQRPSRGIRGIRHDHAVERPSFCGPSAPNESSPP